MTVKNRRWLLKRHPDPAELPGPEHFTLDEAAAPEPADGQVLVRAIYLSLDPYMRGRINPGRNYAAGVAVGEVMTGRVVGEVMASRRPGFATGDIVHANIGWQEYGVTGDAELRKIDPALAPISTGLGLLGMPGLTAYFCLLDVGNPRAGDTVLVTAASGAVGSVAGQIAKLKGCRAIAVAGSAAKVAYCTDELGYDAGIDYNADADLSAAVARAAPDGVDVFFDNVGGSVHQAVIERLNVGARIALCGVMSQYNPSEKSRAVPYNLRNILIPRARMQGFLIYDYAAREREGLEALAAWYRAGRIKFRETIAEGLETAPIAFRGLLRGENLGKQLVRVGPEPR